MKRDSYVGSIVAVGENNDHYSRINTTYLPASCCLLALSNFASNALSLILGSTAYSSEQQQQNIYGEHGAHRTTLSHRIQQGQVQFWKRSGLRPSMPAQADSRLADFSIFLKMLIFVILQWNFGSVEVCNRYGMHVGFKSTDSQPKPNHKVDCLAISIIYLLSIVFGALMLLEEGPSSESALKVPGSCESVLLDGRQEVRSCRK